MSDPFVAEQRWERYAAGTGLVFVALVIVSVFLAPQAPKLSDPAEEIQTYFVDNKDGLLLQAFVSGLAAAFFLWFIGSLRSFLRPAEAGTGRLSAVAFGGGVAVVAAVIPIFAVSSALAYSVARESDPGLVRALFEVRHMFEIFSLFPLAVLLGAASIGGGRTRVLPQWLAWFGGLLALGQLVSGMALVFEGSELGPQGWYGLVVFALFLVWVIAVSVLMLQRLGTRSRQG